MVIVWDEPKRVRDLQTHSIDFADVGAKYDFAGADISASHDGRLKSTGFLGDALSTVVSKPLGRRPFTYQRPPREPQGRKAYDRR